MKPASSPRPPEPADANTSGGTSVSRQQQREPALPHEQDEGSGSQAVGGPQQTDVGRKALSDVTGGGADTDKGPLMDKLYNEQVAPDRGPTEPRQ